MKTLIFFAGFVIVSCSVPSDSIVEKDVSDATNDPNLYAKSKLGNDEIAKIEAELPKDSSVNFPVLLAPEITGEYVGSVQILYNHRRPKLVDFIKTILVAKESIKNIRYTEGKIVLNVFSNDSVNYYEDAGFLNYSWRYYYAHDIYGSFFSYEEIDTVVVLMEDELDTWFPSSGDTDGLLPPQDYMLRKWYVPSLDYLKVGMIDMDNPSHFSDYKNFRIKENVLDSLLKRNR